MQDKIAFIYPGQGAQKVGMGKEFYEQCPLAKEVFDEADKVLDFDLKAVCFEENDLINETAYTQPALVATSLAITKVVESMGLTPNITAGLSLGEYSAIAEAGGMDAIDAIRLVRARGRYMQEAVPNHEGAMAAILGLGKEEVTAALEGMEGVWGGKYNCPGQIAITGKKEAVEKAADRLKEAGCKRVVFLNVSGPFHCPMMEPAAKKLQEELVHTTVFPLRIPYVTNVTAEKVENENEIKGLLTSQVTHSVLWEQSVRAMIADGVTTFIEIGPGRTLSNFIKKIDRNVKTYQIGTVQEMEQVVGEVLCKEIK